MKKHWFISSHSWPSAQALDNHQPAFFIAFPILDHFLIRVTTVIYMILCDWLLSMNMCLRLSHVLTCISTSFSYRFSPPACLLASWLPDQAVAWLLWVRFHPWFCHLGVGSQAQSFLSAGAACPGCLLPQLCYYLLGDLERVPIFSGPCFPT